MTTGTSLKKVIRGRNDGSCQMRAIICVLTCSDLGFSLQIDFPADKEIPSGPVSCNCPGHLEKLDLERTFDISAKTMDFLLFGDNSPLWKEYHERRNNKGTAEQ